MAEYSIHIAFSLEEVGEATKKDIEAWLVVCFASVACYERGSLFMADVHPEWAVVSDSFFVSVAHTEILSLRGHIEEQEWPIHGIDIRRNSANNSTGELGVSWSKTVRSPI